MKNTLVQLIVTAGILDQTVAQTLDETTLGAVAKAHKIPMPMVVCRESFTPAPTAKKPDPSPVSMLAVRPLGSQGGPYGGGFSAGPGKWKAIAEALESGALTLEVIKGFVAESK